MAHTFRQKLSSYFTLFALLVNLLPPAPIAQAAEEALLPADTAHHSPTPLLIFEHKPLTPVALRPDALLPSWFNPLAAPPLDANQMAGLSLAKPAAIAHLPEWPVPPADPAVLPVNEILPRWFRAEVSRQQPVGGSEPVINSFAKINKFSSPAAILPAWFIDQTKIVSPRPDVTDILPGWFKAPPYCRPQWSSL